ncbi:hypothetical protein Cni_G04156 [Canna indica]|uniref:Uncharacterized protein n=1 Tax=Canna indica TaxID=4628 RepID=A0AAQ3JSG7_9LILI|nr:hypothetical protein Cni_G04156 [Canna indica]
MGNCQAAEAATVLIQHPGGKVERAYWSLTASHVMASNPGHYVAAVIVTTAPPYAAANSTSAAASSRARGDAHVKHLKLLRPDDTLHIGRVYRLVSFEEVLREFASKKHVKLSRLLIKQKEKHNPATESSGGGGVEGEPETSPGTTIQSQEQEVDAELGDAMHELPPLTTTTMRSKTARHGQWRPTLQSIAEVGNT